MAETIKATLPLCNLTKLRSVKVKIGKGASNAPANDTVVPAGYPVFLSSVTGQEYDVFNKTGIATAITTAQIGVLMEPWTVSATQTDIHVAYAGEFYLDAIYNRCGSTLLPETTVTKSMFRNSKGHIVFTDRKDVDIYKA